MDFAAIHAYLRSSVSAWRDCEHRGPFLASFSRSSDNPFLNYAIPDDGAEPTRADVVALIAAYEHRGLRPRLEYIPELAPAVEPALLTAGFVVEGHLALMEPRIAVMPEPPPGVELIEPSDEASFLGVRIVQHEAYAEPEPPGDAQVASLRSALASGGGAVLARTIADFIPVGAGEFSPIVGGVTEITSIGVVTAYRRRGIGAAMTAWLLHAARSRGATTPFLMANEAESRVYARVGFETRGSILHISRPA